MRATLWQYLRNRDENPVREFGCWTAALHELAVQATGICWIAVYDVPEQHGIQVVLVNARYKKNVHGRKTEK